MNMDYFYDIFFNFLSFDRMTFNGGTDYLIDCEKKFTFFILFIENLDHYCVYRFN